MKKDVLDESKYVDLSDEDLKESLGFMWERCKSLREAEKTDPDVCQMRDKLKSYIEDNFRVERKDVERHLKAARQIAKLRGLKWKPLSSK